MILFLALLALLFIGLKLANVINWSWGWVLAPLIAVGVIVVIMTIAVASLG